MLIVTTINLRPYIQKRIVISELKTKKSGHGRGQLKLEGEHGIWRGPVFVLEEVTRDKYRAEKEQEFGRPLTQQERSEIWKPWNMFFRLSVD